MNIPETIRIGSCNYKILKTKHNIVLNGRQCYGAIDYDKHEIELSENIGDKQQIELTLLHELFHGLFCKEAPIFKCGEELQFF